MKNGEIQAWLQFRKRQRVAEIDGKTGRFVSFLDEGAGAPVVFLHGIPTWGFLWHRQIPALSKTNRVLVPDLVGFGFSDKRDSFDRSVSSQAKMIDFWMEKIGIRKASIVAHDMGGGVALRLATLFPHRVERLCVMNTICYDSFPIEAMIQFGHPEMRRTISAQTVQTTLKTALRSGFSSSSSASETLDNLLAPYQTEVSKTSLICNASALNTNHTTEITNLLPQINAPTLVLWGEEDKFLPIKFGKRLASDIPGAQFYPIEKASHFVMLDQPDKINEHLTYFLAA